MEAIQKMEQEREGLVEEKNELAQDLASIQETTTKLRAEAKALSAQQEEL